MPTVSRPSPSTRGRGARAQMQLDALGCERVAHRLADRRRLVREHAVGALDDGHGGAHPPQRLAELHADRAGAEHEQPPGNLRHPGGLAVGPDAVELAQAGDRWDHGVRSRREHDLRGRIRAVADDHATGPVQSRVTAEHGDPLGLGPGRLAGVVVSADHEVAPGEGGGGVERAGHGLAGAGRLASCGDGLARAQQRLRRDAAPVRAFAAEQLALDDRHAQVAGGQAGGAVLAGRSAADDDDVEVTHARPLALSISYAAVISPMWL
jgi:hypothetical protein